MKRNGDNNDNYYMNYIRLVWIWQLYELSIVLDECGFIGVYQQKHPACRPCTDLWDCNVYHLNSFDTICLSRLQFAARRVLKIYLALCHGHLPHSTKMIEASLCGLPVWVALQIQFTVDRMINPRLHCRALAKWMAPGAVLWTHMAGPPTTAASPLKQNDHRF